MLQKLDEFDKKAEKARINIEKYDARVEFYGLSFVEYLSGPELVETMFDKDKEGQMLLQIGGELHGYLQLCVKQPFSFNHLSYVIFIVIFK